MGKDNFDRLTELCGNWQDGSNTGVCLYIDEATKTYHITVGTNTPKKKRYYGHSWEEVLEKAYADRPLEGG